MALTNKQKKLKLQSVKLEGFSAYNEGATLDENPYSFRNHFLLCVAANGSKSRKAEDFIENWSKFEKQLDYAWERGWRDGELYQI